MEIWIPVFGAAVTAFGAVLITLYTQRQTRRDVRTMIKSDLEALQLLKDLEPDGEGYEKLNNHVLWRIGELTSHERGARRDGPQIVAVLLVWSIALGIAIPAFYAGSWWLLSLIVAGFLFLFGCAGIPAFKKKVRET